MCDITRINKSENFGIVSIKASFFSEGNDCKINFYIYIFLTLRNYCAFQRYFTQTEETEYENRETF